MKSCKPLLLLLLVARISSAQGFQHFLDRINSLPDSSRQEVADSLVASAAAIPIVEQDSVVHFIYTGNANTVSMAGDVNNWQTNVSNLTRIYGTKLWYFTQTYEPDARLEYKIVINGTNWILDPRNPNQIMEGFGPNSELRMPKYVPPVEVNYFSNIPHGSVFDTSWTSVNLGNSRKIEVYLPPGYPASADSFPVMYFQDGTESVALGKYENIIDYLTANKLIRPLIAVFVSYVNRTPEYAGNQVTAYMKYFTEELVPFVDSRFRTIKDPKGRGVAGASYGGNISLWLAYTYPHLFGNVSAQSSYVDPTLSSGFQNGTKLDIRTYMDIGTYDIPSLVPMVHNMVQILQSRGYDYEFRQYDEGHAWGNWRAHIGNALLEFFPPVPSNVKNDGSGPQGFQLNQNYPNPFNPRTIITYRLSSPGYISLKVYDVLGREVTTLVAGVQSAGDHSATFNALGFSSGIYFYRLETGGLNQVKKLTLLQ